MGAGGSFFSDKSGQRESFLWQLTLVLVLLGVLLRLRQYLFNRSLWLDEAMLGNNVVERGFAQLLTEPLADNQSAPPGFLAAARATVELFGPHDWALRVFPLAAGILSILLAFLLAQRELRSLAARAAFVGLMAASPILVFYSSEFKQYSSDVFFSLCILTAFSCRSARQGTWLLSVAGFVALQFSLPAFFVAAAAALLLLYEAARSSRWQQAIIVGLVWAVGAALHGLYFLQAGVDLGFMRPWWGERNAFAPVAIDSMRDISWYPKALTSLVYHTFLASGPVYPGFGKLWRFNPLQWFLAIVFILSVVAAIRSRRAIFILALGSILFTLAASALQIYPFSSRLIVFLAPMVLLLMAAGIDDLEQRAGFMAAGVLALVLFLIPIPKAVMVAWQPVSVSDMRGALREMRKQFEEGDAVVGALSSDALIRFYRNNLPSSAPVFHIPSEIDTDLITNVVRKHGFRRVWFVSAHVTRRDTKVLEETERAAPAVFRWRMKGTRLMLFDFSDSLIVKTGR